MYASQDKKTHVISTPYTYATKKVYSSDKPYYPAKNPNIYCIFTYDMILQNFSPKDQK